MREIILSLIAGGCNQHDELAGKLTGTYTIREIQSSITLMICDDTISCDPNGRYVITDYSRVSSIKPLILDAIRRHNYNVYDIANYIGVDACDNEFVLSFNSLRSEGEIVRVAQLGYVVKETKPNVVISHVLYRAYCALEYLRHDGTPSYIGKVSRLVSLAERIAAKYDIAAYYTEMIDNFKLELSNFDFLTIKKNNDMKTIKERIKVTFVNDYTSQSLNLHVRLSYRDIADYVRDHDRDIIFGALSDGQRERIEKYFGKINAYYTRIVVDGMVDGVDDTIDSLYDLADYINGNGYNQLVVNRLIVINDWVDTSEHSIYSVCQDGDGREVVLDENTGKAKVV